MASSISGGAKFSRNAATLPLSLAESKGRVNTEILTDPFGHRKGRHSNGTR